MSNWLKLLRTRDGPETGQKNSCWDCYLLSLKFWFYDALFVVTTLAGELYDPDMTSANSSSEVLAKGRRIQLSAYSDLGANAAGC